jgi:hypothetical protein
VSLQVDVEPIEPGGHRSNSDEIAVYEQKLGKGSSFTSHEPDLRVMAV